MVGAKTIGCINHPNLEAIGRCRQCSKPVCSNCGVRGAKGLYCSDICREKHEQFMERAKDTDLERATRRGLFFHLRKLIGSLIMLGVVLFALGFTAYHIFIPVLTPLTLWALDLFFIYWNRI